MSIVMAIDAEDGTETLSLKKLREEEAEEEKRLLKNMKTKC